MLLKGRAAFVVAVSLLSIGLLRLSAQEPAPPTIRSEVTRVVLDVSVLDKKGRFVPGLTRENFRLWDDGSRQTIRDFYEESQPIRLALVIESGPAVFLIRQDHIVAAIELLRSLRAADEVALLTFSDRLWFVHDFTREKEAVVQILLGGRYAHSRAEIFTRDALAGTLDWLGDGPDRVSVLLIGTGLDTGSRFSSTAMNERWGRVRPHFFAVAAGAILRDPKAPFAPFEEADALLRAAAAASGGEVWFPESAAELPGIYRRLGERLRNTYTLVYKPSDHPRDGSFHKITIELVDAKGKPMKHRVLARDGYFVAKP